MSQFVDQVRVQVESGDGGNGMVAWRREKYEPMGGPAGGNGGRGGHVYLEASHNLSTLLDFHYKKEFKAAPGEKGGPKNRHGRSGEDLVIKVPVGTLVKDVQQDIIIADLKEDGQRVLVAEGGRGGRGNTDLSSHGNRAPHYCEPGELGITRMLELELKLLADVGVIGLPNAGKSTLLSVMTAAKPKIADYPFSTLQPNLGVVKNPSGDGFVMADIPGLVEGASKGVGLGHKFLRHVERTRVLVHMVDITDPELEKNISTIAEELRLYNPKMESLPQVLALNKSDVLDDEMVDEICDVIEKRLPELVPNAESITEIIPISCATTEGISDLRNVLLEELSKIPEDTEIHHVMEDVGAYQHPDEGFEVYRQKGKFYVEGTRVERFAAVTNMRSSESLHHFFQVLRAMGVLDELLKQGIQPGHEVIIGDTTFVFGDEMY
jgi:GTPase